MAYSKTPDSNLPEPEIKEAIRKIAEVTSETLHILNSRTEVETSESSDLDIQVEQAKEDQVKRRNVLEAENDRKRQKLTRQWKRY